MPPKPSTALTRPAALLPGFLLPAAQAPPPVHWLECGVVSANTNPDPRPPLWLRLLARLPLPVLHALGALCGWLLWWLPTGPRRRTAIHLERCFPDWSARERGRVARRSLAHLGRGLAESALLWFGSAHRVRGLVHAVQGEDLWREALAQGRGTILLTPHLGAWEIAGLYCADRAPMTILYKPQKGDLDRAMQRGRARFGARLVPSTGGGVRALLRALQAGESIGVLPDQDPPRGSGVFVPFFGIEAHTPVLVSRLAVRTGAPVLFVVAERLRWGRGFTLRFEPAPAGVADADPEVAAAALNAGVESLVRRHPEQYYWSYPRYRRRPPHERGDWYRIDPERGKS